MNYRDAETAALQGRKIRRRAWNDESYVALHEGRLRVFLGNHREPAPCWIGVLEEALDDWQILGDPA